MLPTFDIVTVLGTRPEIIKLAPVLRALRAYPTIRNTTIATGQHAELGQLALETDHVQADYSLDLMTRAGDFADFLARAVHALFPLVEQLAPAAVLVQGDTATALAGALVAANLDIPVVHVEAGLRSGDDYNPYPEEALRVLISHCASLHCAPTRGNVENLLREGITASAIRLTGNPVIDSVIELATNLHPSATLERILAHTTATARVVVTCHRHENFGARMGAYFDALREFADQQPNVSIIFPVHPNPNVETTARTLLGGHPRIHLVAPMTHADFLCLMQSARLVISDSGGVQEETAALGIPLVILRKVTERQEAVMSGGARLACDGRALRELLAPIASAGRWPDPITVAGNPFGDGRSGARIAACVHELSMTTNLPSRSGPVTTADDLHPHQALASNGE